MEDLFSLKGKFIVITGGTRGIGRAISIQLARAGAIVLANYVRDVKSAESLKAEVTGQGHELSICRADITSTKGVERLMEAIEKSGENISGFIHCAATGVHRRIDELTTRHFDWTFSLNVRAYFDLITLLLPLFNKGASIVAISSAGAVRAEPTYSLVGASKGALESLSRHLAVELAPKNIRVNIVSAGAILTDAWKELPESEKRLAERVRRSPYGRLATPEEVACSVQFLCSDAASGVNGHTLVVDGGERIADGT